jgi:hypothetical protein
MYVDVIETGVVAPFRVTASSTNAAENAKEFLLNIRFPNSISFQCAA